MGSQASEAAEVAESQRNPNRNGGHLSLWTQLTKTLPKNASWGCRALSFCCQGPEEFSKSLQSIFTFHRSPKITSWRCSSQSFCLASGIFKQFQRQKSTNSARSPFQALQLSSFSCQPFLHFVKVITKQKFKNPTTLGLVSKSCPSLWV